MNSLNRRSALAFGMTTVGALPALLMPASAAGPGADKGEQVAPGVKRVELSKRASEIPAYATVSMVDLVFQPHSKFTNPSMASDMVCHCVEGELMVDQGAGMQFTARAGDVWSCRKGMPETTENRGGSVSIMRVISLVTKA